MQNCILFSTDLTLRRSEFQRVGAAPERALVPILVPTLGTKSRSELEDESCLDCLAGVSSECKYTGYLDESIGN